MTMNSHLAPEDEPRIVTRATGPRREAPSRCYTCGHDVEDGPRFGAESTCDECRRNPPLCRGEVRAKDVTT